MTLFTSTEKSIRVACVPRDSVMGPVQYRRMYRARTAQTTHAAQTMILDLLKRDRYHIHRWPAPPVDSQVAMLLQRGHKVSEPSFLGSLRLLLH